MTEMHVQANGLRIYGTSGSRALTAENAPQTTRSKNIYKYSF